MFWNLETTISAIRDIINPIPAEGLDSFGIDPDGPIPIESDNIVNVDDVYCPLQEQDKDDFEELFDPLSPCNDYGISLYIEAKQYVYAKINSYED